MLLSIQETARRLNLSPKTIRQSPHIAKIRPNGEHGHLRVPLAEVERIIASGTVKGADR
ncbi:hypothetical protein [Rhizobium oryzicola]|uniref:Helix-turn-helix domain-containing protein n=1 Tax=Rhizobium oryzicola TaxID=1232668 RepID=A0ABT8SRD6_9HYPH|nr:hypothetical protein [Rhizobium oryzicola]MDO1580906.1 hypothetical protein [Rhizobium oryzicola]